VNLSLLRQTLERQVGLDPSWWPNWRWPRPNGVQPLAAASAPRLTSAASLPALRRADPPLRRSRPASCTVETLADGPAAQLLEILAQPF